MIGALVEPLLLNHCAHGAQQNDQVQFQAPVVAVFLVQFHLAQQRNAVTPVDLGPAGEAGLHGMAQAVIGDVLLELLHEGHAFGTGTDEAHVALDDVPDLGQLVDAHLADELAHAGHAGVVGGGPDGAVLFGVGTHGAELVDREFLFIQAHAILTVDDRARRFQTDQQGGDEHDGRGRDEQHQGQEQVEGALQAAQAALLKKKL